MVLLLVGWFHWNCWKYGCPTTGRTPVAFALAELIVLNKLAMVGSTVLGAPAAPAAWSRFTVCCWPSVPLYVKRPDCAACAGTVAASWEFPGTGTASRLAKKNSL